MNTVDESSSEVFQVRVDRFISKEWIDSSYLILIIAFSRKVPNNSYFQYKFVKTVLPSHSNPHTKFMWHNTFDIRSLVKLTIEFHCLFSFLIKYYHIIFIIIVLWLSGLLFFMPALLLSILTPLFLPSSTLSLSYFVLAVPCESVWENSCMSSHVLYSNTEWDLFFREAR